VRILSSPLFEGQGRHAAALVVLLFATAIASRYVDTSGMYLGVTSMQWLAIAVAVPIVHQAYVMLVWRVELHTGAISDWLGLREGFLIYGIVFVVLGVGRPISLFALAMANAGTLALSNEVALAIAATLVLPVIYLQHSVVKYFGFRRALGADHFDERYRAMPLVREGIFRFIPNAMYAVGFLALWAIAVAFRSEAALVAAAFAHAYIWVHYYFTEKPDMDRIYAS
jgi:hypothetical protein